jgi:molybdopterin synthase sulfur carrier subunit
MKVKVLFFGVLTDITGTSFKQYSEVKDISDLKHRIIDDFPQVVHYDYRISLNNELIYNNPELKDDDEVALLPPFAGG